ncbi:uncharacterized protein LOC120770738 [Bactrocera tryoni]|uniref:uncharacterized protein LOC120770738 n=1 Tax=Bactrocera tryoni TaxID=59916 RepID=UPI001A95BB94|nr:uncharacterized protein LOC120770738 [Bactrocera tryoni]
MPITVHKVLIHGSKMVSEAILPIGMLSEEAQEAMNKEYRNCRLFHSRKNSRISTNEDNLSTCPPNRTSTNLVSPRLSGSTNEPTDLSDSAKLKASAKSDNEST